MSLILGLLLIALQEGTRPRPTVEPCPAGQEVLLTGGRFLDPDVGVVLGGNLEEGPSVLLRTMDAGRTWRAVGPEVPARLYDVHFCDDRHGWAVGLAGAVLRTTDQGAHWSPVDGPGRSWLAGVWFVTAEHGWVAGGSADGLLLYETRDAGATWLDARDRVPEKARGQSLRDLFFLDDRNGWCAGGGGTLLRTQDGGASWQGVNLETDAWLRAVTFADPQHGVVVGAGGVVRETRDGGSTFVTVSVESSPKFNDAAFDARGGLWLVSMDGRLLWRGAGQDAFQELLVRRGALTKLALLGDGSGYVIGDGGYVARLTLAEEDRP